MLEIGMPTSNTSASVMIDRPKYPDWWCEFWKYWWVYCLYMVCEAGSRRAMSDRPQEKLHHPTKPTSSSVGVVGLKNKQISEPRPVVTYHPVVPLITPFSFWKYVSNLIIIVFNSDRSQTKSNQSNLNESNKCIELRSFVLILLNLILRSCSLLRIN